MLPPRGPKQWLAAILAAIPALIAGPAFSSALLPVVWDLSISGLSMLLQSGVSSEPGMAMAGAMYLLTGLMIGISLPLGTCGLWYLIYQALLEA
jgi:hypothetical protein